MLTYPKNLEGSITIIGENGTVRIGGVAVNEIQHWEFAEPGSRTTSSVKQRELRDHLGLRLRSSAVLRQRHQGAARRGRARDRRTRGPALARAADRQLPVGARRPPRRAAAGVLSMADYRCSSHARSSTRARRIGDGTRIWHWVHVSAQARDRRRAARSGQNVYVGNRVRDRQQRQDPEQRLGLRQRDARGRRVLRAEHGVHERLQPALGGDAQGRVPRHAGEARRDARRELHDRLRRRHRRVRVRRRRHA